MSARNQIEDIEVVNDGMEKVAIIEYLSLTREKLAAHTMILSLFNIERISLNEFSFSIACRNNGLQKFGVLNSFDHRKIARLAKYRFGEKAGLKVMKHFSIMRTNPIKINK